MAFSLSSSPRVIPYSYTSFRSDSFVELKCFNTSSAKRITRRSLYKRNNNNVPVVVISTCEMKNDAEAEVEIESEAGGGIPGRGGKSSRAVEIGSPIIITEAPRMIKTAASVPCLRVNSGVVKPGDVGRIVSRKPKDVWAVRLTIGTYLIDGKYFKLLDLDE